MNIALAEWLDAGHSMCGAMVDGVEMFIPEGSPHWPYLQAAIAAGLVAEEFAAPTPAEITIALDAEAAAAVSAPAIMAWVEAILGLAEKNGALPTPAERPALAEMARANYKKEILR